jgi:hypothetical protein
MDCAGAPPVRGFSRLPVRLSRHTGNSEYRCAGATPKSVVLRFLKCGRAHWECARFRVWGFPRFFDVDKFFP